MPKNSSRSDRVFFAQKIRLSARKKTLRRVFNKTWHYVDDSNRSRRIELFFDPRSQKLLVLADGKPVVAAKNLSKTDGVFPFFIEEELFKLTALRGPNGQIHFEFDIDRDSDTPRNRLRHFLEKRRDRKTWLFAAATFAVIAIFGWFAIRAFREKNRPRTPAETAAIFEKKLETEGRRAAARVEFLRSENDTAQTVLALVFSLADSTETAVRLIDTAGLAAIFPLERGDSLPVVYLPRVPSIYKIDFTQLAENQSVALEKRATAFHFSLHPEVGETHAACFARVARQQKGLAGLADIFCQKIDPSASKSGHDRDSFLRLTRDEKFKKALFENCF